MRKKDIIKQKNTTIEVNKAGKREKLEMGYSYCLPNYALYLICCTKAG